MEKVDIHSNERKNFFEEAKRFIQEHEDKGIEPTEGIIITNIGNRLICGEKGTILAMISYLLNYLYNENLITDWDLDKIEEIAKMSNEEIDTHFNSSLEDKKIKEELKKTLEELNKKISEL